MAKAVTGPVSRPLVLCWPSAMFLGAERHQTGVCSRFDTTFSLCVCILMSPFYNDTSRIGLRACPTAV